MRVPRSNSSLHCMTALEFENLHQTSKKERPGNSSSHVPWMHAPLCCKRNEHVLLLSRRQRTGCDLFQSSSSYLQDYVFSRCGDLQLESGSTIKPHQLWDFRFPLCDFSHPLDKKYQFSHASRWKSPHKTDQKILVLKMASEPQRILFEKNSCSPTSHPS